MMVKGKGKGERGRVSSSSFIISRAPLFPTQTNPPSRCDVREDFGVRVKEGVEEAKGGFARADADVVEKRDDAGEGWGLRAEAREGWGGGNGRVSTRGTT